ncbi:type VI secretion system baseplate subunit TssE [Saccharophagus sp. K07]|jgi:type VI secretion system protein ImpF|uniref:type VI secretion system baseplate subunit TssE n=1 Tax=Saccharophagus sp. K07 TaxID=2283636 RepID=UPI0016524E87|nr:type VI secretion system baseplate subunit TssE [Saccharophagus sp. K07]MBC6906067.1 type VI secretion system baseplate subunit TssE [Saccharophagus sp. K07]
MSPAEKDRNLRESILDRLFDDEPDISVDSEKTRQRKLKDLRNSVRRDLENLLNSRFRIVSPPENLKEVENSLMNYGLPDLATVNMLDVTRRREFTRSIENIIRTFEPRFKSVSVRYLDNDEKSDRTLRFRIDAVMYADPAPEIVVFDSVLEPVLRAVTVEESKHG